MIRPRSPFEAETRRRLKQLYEKYFGKFIAERRGKKTKAEKRRLARRKVLEAGGVLGDQEPRHRKK